MHGLQQEAHILGLDLGVDRVGRVVHRYLVAQGDQPFQLGDARLEFGIVLVHRQLALIKVQFQAGQQQFKGRCHELAGEGLGDFATAAQAVGQFDPRPDAFDLAVFDHIV